MLKKISIMVAVILMMASVAAVVLAADKVTGKVTKVETDKVTVAIEGSLPAWIKVGGNVAAVGGGPKVLSINGNEVTLKFSRAKAAKIKVDSTMSLGEFTGAELQGC
jgi:hypothetical protein